MSQFILFGFLLTFIINISADSCSYNNILGQICGNYPWTFCCPVNTQCGSYANRLCYTESNKIPTGGIIVAVIIGLFIFIMILKACITCCSSRNNYFPLSSSDPAYLSRSGAVVCTVAATHC